MKTFLQTILFVQTLLIIFSFELSAQTFEWAKGISSNIFVQNQGMAIDSKGNSYITGYFIGTTTFDTFKLTASSSDIYVAKYSPSGTCLWAICPANTDPSNGYGICTDEKGNSYIAGNFGGTLTFGSIQITSYGNDDIVIAKFDSSGICLWAKHAGSTVLDHGSAIQVDGNGNCIVTGYFATTATFGAYQLTSYGSSDIFIAKYDENGNCLWAKQAGGYSYDSGFGEAVDVNGNICITGTFTGTATFGTIQITGYGQNDIFTARYDSSGNCLWAKHAGTKDQEMGNAIAFDSNLNSYITGYFMNIATFGINQITSNGLSDIFTAKYDSSGNCLWANDAGGAGWDNGTCISVDTKGNSYVGGTFQDTAFFGDEQISSLGGYDIFVAKYDSSGKLLWVKQAGGAKNDAGYGIFADANGNCYLTGNFLSTATFGSFQLTSSTPGTFIAKISDAPTGIEAELNFTPGEYSLEQNFPNPFNPSTRIKYSLPFDSKVRIIIYNALGQVVSELWNGFKGAGTHEVSFNASGFSSGVYFYSIQANSTGGGKNFTATKKMILLK
jgi:hypothetical protein